MSRGNNYDASADNDVSSCFFFGFDRLGGVFWNSCRRPSTTYFSTKSIHIAHTQDAREKKKESCQWCGNHIKSTICLGVLFILLFAGILLTHLFIYWSKYLARVRPDDKVMSIGAIPFPAVTICPGTRAGYPPLNFTHLLRVMQVYREPQLKLDEYVYLFTYLFAWFPFIFVTNFQLFAAFTRKYAMETLLQIYPEDILSSVRSPEFLEKFSREEYQFGIFGLISSRITEYTKNCRWLNEKIPCNANFRPIITEEGKCFSFVRHIHRRNFFYETFWFLSSIAFEHESAVCLQKYDYLGFFSCFKNLLKHLFELWIDKNDFVIDQRVTLATISQCIWKDWSQKSPKQ